MQQARTMIITGPTGIGKTDLALHIGAQQPSAIINADVGQFYTPLTIGTAKPDWHKSLIPHYLFDVLDDPVNMSVVGYRNLITPIIAGLGAKEKLPIIVGGSGFYIDALFFSQTLAKVAQQVYQKPTLQLWHELQHIDPERAAAIQPADRYRIQRALDVWYNLGIKPSVCRPQYAPISRAVIFMLTAPVEFIYARINARVKHMFAAGWIDEVRALSTTWQDFLLTKKLIGYDDIVLYLRTPQLHAKSYDELVARIQQRTRNYAKRQLTFNRMLTKKLAHFTEDVRVLWLDVAQKDFDSRAKLMQYIMLSDDKKG